MKRALIVIAMGPWLVLTSVGVVAQNTDRPAVAGTTPDRRPEAAPVIQETGMTSYGRALALRGVSKPTPKNLNFLDDQGAWYTPFVHPGATAPYDIRALHGGSK